MNVGLVGSGVVGRFLGRRLLDAGHALFVHDIDPAAAEVLVPRGAVVRPGARELAADCEVILASVPTPEDSLAVALGERGVLPAARPGLLYIETSTIGPECARRLAEEARQRGVDYFDAPLSAGPRVDGRSELTLWVGGRGQVFAERRAFLGQLAEHVVFCGPAGNAQVVKLVNNVVSICLIAVLGDTLALGVKAGVPLEILRLGLLWGTGQTRMMDEMFPYSTFVGEFRPGYRMTLAEKDWRLAQELAEQVGAPLPSTGMLRELFARARERGWDDLSVHALARLSEEAAGIQLRLQHVLRAAQAPEELP